MLEVDGVHTYYGESHILHGVSLRVESGEVVALLGRNGAAKTTLIRSIVGFTPPRQGRIVLDGRPVHAWPPYRIARAGVALVAGNIELSTETNLVNRQIIFAIVGFVVVFIISAIDYRLFSAISQPLYLATAFFLAALTIAGQALYGSARWFDTGVILIQPSEIAKIVVVLPWLIFSRATKIN